MNRGNNFHKTQQCEKEKIIKGREKGLEGKSDPKENILFNTISEILSTFRAIAPISPFGFQVLLLCHEAFFFVWK